MNFESKHADFMDRKDASPDTERMKHTASTRAASFISLIRPVNAGIAFAGIAAAGFVAGAESADWPAMALAGAAGALVAVSGNALNDVLDAEIDRVNKPGRPVASGAVSEREGLFVSAASGALGIVASAVLGLLPLIISTAALTLVVRYAAALKRVPLLGNVIVAAVTGAAFLFGASSAGNIQAGIIPALLAFGINLPREILKDVEDMAGDESAGVPTFPLRFGARPALVLAAALIILLLLASPLPYFTGIYSAAYPILLFAGVHILLIVGLIRLRSHPTPQEAGRIAVAMKYVMLAGLAAIIAGSLL